MESNNTDLVRPSHKRKRSATSSSSLCFSCCFRKLNNESKSTNVVDTENHRPPQRLTRTSSAWLKSRISDFPDFQNRYKNIVSKLGRRHAQRHPRRHASDFNYDAFSYALNFDDGVTRDDDFIPPRSFSARLPPKADSDAAAAEDTVDLVSSSQPIGEVSAFKFPIGD